MKIEEAKAQIKLGDYLIFSPKIKGYISHIYDNNIMGIKYFGVLIKGYKDSRIFWVYEIVKTPAGWQVERGEDDK